MGQKVKYERISYCVQYWFHNDNKFEIWQMNPFQINLLLFRNTVIIKSTLYTYTILILKLNHKYIIITNFLFIFQLRPARSSAFWAVQPAFRVIWPHHFLQTHLILFCFTRMFLEHLFIGNWFFIMFSTCIFASINNCKCSQTK